MEKAARERFMFPDASPQVKPAAAASVVRNRRIR
jgi:hypothetical protein